MTMSNIINNLLLEGDKFMPDMSSRQSVFSHRARGKKSNMSKQEKTSDMSTGKKKTKPVFSIWGFQRFSK